MDEDQYISFSIEKLLGDDGLNLQPIGFPNTSPFACIYPKLNASLEPLQVLQVNSAMVEPPRWGNR